MLEGVVWCDGIRRMTPTASLSQGELLCQASWSRLSQSIHTHKHAHAQTQIQIQTQTQTHTRTQRQTQTRTHRNGSTHTHTHAAQNSVHSTKRLEVAGTENQGHAGSSLQSGRASRRAEGRLATKQRAPRTRNEAEAMQRDGHNPKNSITFINRLRKPLHARTMS